MSRLGVLKITKQVDGRNQFMCFASKLTLNSASSCVTMAFGLSLMRAKLSLKSSPCLGCLSLSSNYRDQSKQKRLMSSKTPGSINNVEEVD